MNIRGTDVVHFSKHVRSSLWEGPFLDRSSKELGGLGAVIERKRLICPYLLDKNDQTFVFLICFQLFSYFFSYRSALTICGRAFGV